VNWFKKNKKENKLKIQEKITEKLRKEYEKKERNYILSKTPTRNDENKLSELKDNWIESLKKEQQIKTEEVNQIRIENDIYEMIKLKIEDLLEQEDFKNLLKKLGRERVKLFENISKQLGIKIVLSKGKMIEK